MKAADRFLDALDGVADPETEAQDHRRDVHPGVRGSRGRATGDPRFLVQGTLYPDIVESGGGDNATIKSHHNVGGLPDDMNFELVEPLRNLFKDEVRDRRGARAARGDRVAPAVPGPGLAVRIIGTITPERLEILRHADAIVVDEIRAPGCTVRSGRASPCCPRCAPSA